MNLKPVPHFDTSDHGQRIKHIYFTLKRLLGNKTAAAQELKLSLRALRLIVNKEPELIEFRGMHKRLTLKEMNEVAKKIYEQGKQDGYAMAIRGEKLR